jgi:hypothetical protein
MAASQRAISRMVWPVVGAELRAGFKRPLLRELSRTVRHLAFIVLAVAMLPCC